MFFLLFISLSQNPCRPGGNLCSLGITYSHHNPAIHSYAITFTSCSSAVFFSLHIFVILLTPTPSSGVFCLCFWTLWCIRSFFFLFHFLMFAYVLHCCVMCYSTERIRIYHTIPYMKEKFLIFDVWRNTMDLKSARFVCARMMQQKSKCRVTVATQTQWTQTHTHTHTEQH